MCAHLFTHTHCTHTHTHTHTHPHTHTHTHTHTYTHTRIVKGHIRKGHALLGLKDTVKAMTAFQDALEIDPNNQVGLIVVLRVMLVGCVSLPACVCLAAVSV